MLQSDLTSQLPDHLDPERCRELAALRAGLTSAYGETRVIAHDDELLALTRESAIADFEAVELSPEAPLRLRLDGWQTELVLTTAAGAEHALPLSGAEVAELSARLERFYEDREDWRTLAELLRLAINTNPGGERLEGLLRLGELSWRRLDRVDDALACFEQVLEARPDHSGAVAGIERLFLAGHRQRRIAAPLEAHYRRHHEHQKLATLLASRAVLLDTSADRAAAWLEAARIRQSRLDDLEGALMLAGEALVETPDQPEISTAFLEISSAAGLWDQTKTFLEAALSRAEEPWSRAALLRELARVCHEELEDLSRAESASRELLELTPESLELWQRLEKVLEKRERWDELAEALERQADLMVDPEALAELKMRQGDLLLRQLDDLDGARQAFERALEHTPEPQVALERLAEVHSRRDDLEALLDTTDRRCELTTEAVAWLQLAAEAAETAEQLGRSDEAISRWLEVLKRDPRHQQGLEQLLALYADAGRSAEMIDTIERQAAAAASAEEAAQLFLMAAEASVEHLIDDRRTLELLNRANRAAPGQRPVLEAMRSVAFDLGRDRELISALRGLLDLEGLDDDQRRQACVDLARALERLDQLDEATELWRQLLDDSPQDREVYDALDALWSRGERWSELVTLLEGRLYTLNRPSARVAVLTRLAEIHGDHLDDRERAIETLQEALKLEPADPEVTRRLDEQLRANGEWTRLARLHQDLARASEDRSERGVRVSAAVTLLLDQLHRPEEALDLALSWLATDWRSPQLVDATAQAAVACGDWRRTLTALAEIQGDLGRGQMVFARRTAAITRALEDQLSGAELTLGLARHFEEVVQQLDEAEERYLAALRTSPSAEARAGLRRTLRAKKRWRELADWLERWVMDDEVPRAERRQIALELAEIATTHLDDPDRARAARRRAGGPSPLLVLFLVIAVVVAAVLAAFRADSL